MHSHLDRQLEAILPALATRLGAEPGESVLVEFDEFGGEQKALVEPLLCCGLLSPAEPARAVLCEGCEESCPMPVQFSQAHADALVGFIVCDKRDDIGRVSVEPERLRRWSISWHGLASVTARALGSAAQPIEQRAGRVWYVGQIELEHQKAEVVLARTPDDIPQDADFAIVLLGHGPKSMRRSIGIGDAIGFKNATPILRKKVIDEALAPRLDDPTIACEIRFANGDIVLVNHLAVRNRIIASPRFNSSNDNAFLVLYQHPGKKFTLRELQAAAQDRTLADLHKIVENLGFAGTLKKLFFRVSRDAIRFERTVTVGQLATLGIGPLKIR